MRKLIHLMGSVVLSVPWFLLWPVHIWNWAARAHHVPADRRNPLFSHCLGGFGIVLMYLFTLPIALDVRVFVMFFAPYIGAGLPALRIGINLSREYRHLRDMKLLENESPTE
jgi:hypothetical protein